MGLDLVKVTGLASVFSNILGAAEFFVGVLGLSDVVLVLLLLVVR